MNLNVRLEDLDQAALLKTTRRLLAEADALSSRLAAVTEIGIAINNSLDLPSIMEVVARQAKWLMDFQHCSVCLREGEDYRLYVLFGPDERPADDWWATPNIGPALKSGSAQLIRAGVATSFLAQYKSQVIMPLVADKQVMGTINFALPAADAYNTDDMRIGYMLSLQLSAAIRNAHTIDQLQRAQEELSLRVEELDAYGHTIAHDLKSPLSSILFKRDVLMWRHREEFSPETMAHLEAIGDSGHRMARMIDQLLWLAKIRHTDEAIEAVDVRATVDAAVTRFDHSLSELGVDIFVDEDLPPVLGHPQWLEEVFANLISNAIKYRGEDNLTPRIHIHGYYHGERVRYEVCDNGVGIKEADIQKLFSMFSRLHTTQAEGLGLGLSIIHRIIGKLGGDLGVSSSFGSGTTFWFELDPVLEFAFAES